MRRMVGAARPARQGAGRTRAGSDPELAPVGAEVLGLGLLDALHVGTGLGERDRRDRERLAALLRRVDPAVDVALAAVVRRERERLVARVARHQVAQVPGAVGDVDLGRPEVLDGERDAARLARDHPRRRRRDLHEPLRAGARGLAVAEARLGVDHRGDERRVEILVARLLADDVLVAQRQRDLADRVMEARRGERDGEAGDERGAEDRADAPAAYGPPARGRAARRRAADGVGARAHRAFSFSRTRDSASESSSTVPLFATTYVARAALSCCGSWRAARSSTAWCPRADARSRRTSSSAITAIVAS